MGERFATAIKNRRRLGDRGREVEMPSPIGSGLAELVLA
jgi:hypothetical protein